MDGRRDQAVEVIDRAEALSAALDVGAPWLDPVVVAQTRTTIERAITRFELGAGHTVVALVGPTGSGKSSLFNALAAMEIAAVGARRPLTAEPMACVWGEGGSQQLMDWLEVPETRRITRESVLDADGQSDLHGLVLLDLPDHDSTEAIHRIEVDRLVTMVDLLVWVVDPQKYADDALHSAYLQRMVGHDGVMVVVLNQIDRLSADEAQTCERDLRRLLDGDGLAAVPVLPVSATRGDGVDEVRELLAEVVHDRTAIAERVAADLRATTAAVLTGLAPIEPGNGEPPGADRLVTELAAAAGVPTLVDALAAEYRRRGRRRAGWPVQRWLRPLLPRRRSRAGVAEEDLLAVMSAQSPISAPSQRPRVALAVEAAIAESADVLPARWSQAIRDSVAEPEDDLVAGLDQRIGAIDLALVPPRWWYLAAAAQYLLALLTLIGAGWLVLVGVLRLAGSGSGGLSHPRQVAGVALPLLLFAIGLIGGLLLLAVTAWALSVGARRRRLAAQEHLHAAVESVAGERVIIPIRVVLAQHRATRLALVGVDAGRPVPQHRAEPAGAEPEPAALAEPVVEPAMPGGSFFDDPSDPDDDESSPRGDPASGSRQLTA